MLLIMWEYDGHMGFNESSRNINIDMWEKNKYDDDYVIKLFKGLDLEVPYYTDEELKRICNH